MTSSNLSSHLMFFYQPIKMNHDSFIIKMDHVHLFFISQSKLIMT